MEVKDQRLAVSSSVVVHPGNWKSDFHPRVISTARAQRRWKQHTFNSAVDLPGLSGLQKELTGQQTFTMIVFPLPVWKYVT